MNTLVFLSRIQFLVTTLIHFLFVPVSLGLSILTAIMETQYVRTGDEQYKRMAKFWGKLFTVNFAVGVVTGLALEFQFGTNWAGYASYVGEVFGPLLAIEATVAFFLESTFIAVWAFGWDKLSPRAHAASIWLVAIAANVSALWITFANAWMQHPVGYEVVDGRARLTDFVAIITQRAAIIQVIHTLAAAFIVSGFFVAGVSAYHLLKKNRVDFFKKSFRFGLIMATIFSVLQVGMGHIQGMETARQQPTKLAAMESQWETRQGAPMNLLTIPNPMQPGNVIETIGIPGALSFLAYADFNAEVTGLNDFPEDERPSPDMVFMTYFSFRIMVVLSLIFVALVAAAWYTTFRHTTVAHSPRLLKLMMAAIPLTFIATELGWFVTEFGRQPWIVYGVMTVQQAVSSHTVTEVAVTLLGFVIVFGFLAVLNFYLLARIAKAGPEPVEAGQAPDDAETAPLY
jgi:cytochrome d ubiquinol oxidase subunit I